MSFEAWELAAIDRAGYNGITDEHIELVANELRRIGATEISYTQFSNACMNYGINPDNFTQEDFDKLETTLND